MDYLLWYSVSKYLYYRDAWNKHVYAHNRTIPCRIVEYILPINNSNRLLTISIFSSIIFMYLRHQAAKRSFITLKYKKICFYLKLRSLSVEIITFKIFTWKQSCLSYKKLLVRQIFVKELLKIFCNALAWLYKVKTRVKI